MPCLARAGVKRVINPPMIFSSDLTPLLWSHPAPRNYPCAKERMTGFNQGPGMGKLIAGRMTEGEPAMDAFAWDVARFGVRVSGRRDASSCRRLNWRSPVADEGRRIYEAVGLIGLSALARFEVRGPGRRPGSTDCWRGACPNRGWSFSTVPAILPDCTCATPHRAKSWPRWPRAILAARLPLLSAGPVMRERIATFAVDAGSGAIGGRSLWTANPWDPSRWAAGGPRPDSMAPWDMARPTPGDPAPPTRVAVLGRPRAVALSPRPLHDPDGLRMRA